MHGFSSFHPGEVMGEVHHVNRTNHPTFCIDNTCAGRMNGSVEMRFGEIEREEHSVLSQDRF